MSMKPHSGTLFKYENALRTLCWTSLVGNVTKRLGKFLSISVTASYLLIMSKYWSLSLRVGWLLSQSCRQPKSQAVLLWIKVFFSSLPLASKCTSQAIFDLKHLAIAACQRCSLSAPSKWTVDGSNKALRKSPPYPDIPHRSWNWPLFRHGKPLTTVVALLWFETWRKGGDCFFPTWAT